MKFLLAVFLILITPLISNAKEPVTKGETDPVMLDLDPYMIEALRSNKFKGRWGIEGSIVQLMKEPEFQKLIKKHDLRIFNGPMLGSISATSAKVWVRTAGPATFQVKVGDLKSKPVTTTEASDFTGVALIEGLKPYAENKYSILIDGKEIQKDYFVIRTAPKAGQAAKLSITFGSGSRYQPTNEGIWRTMTDQKPMAYLGLGDNVYIDVPKHMNVHRLHYYRRMLRQEYREIIASSGIYAIWDDHDMYDNDSEGGYGINTQPHKMPTYKVFTQNWNNPFNGTKEVPGTYFNFRLGDVEVFMTDGRFYRYGPKSSKKDKNKKPHTMLGPDQKKWLLDVLKKSTAKFKVIASGTMWHADADKGGYDSWAGPKSPYQKERDEIFDFINKEKIDGVVLISGDRHRTDIWKTDRKNGYPLYEFLSAKLTNVHSHGARKEAVWSYAAKNDRFWGQLDFDTTGSEPVVTFKAINQNGKVLKAYPVKLSEISH